MSKLLSLLVLALLVGVSSYAAGMLPLKTDFASKRLNSVSAVSMGIMVGTVMAVVLPEGVETAAHALAGKNLNGLPFSFVVGLPLLAGFVTMYIVDQLLIGRREIRDVQEFLLRISISAGLRSVINSTLTTGLLLHLVVDGMALGVSFLNDSESLKFVFFFIIIVHKLPTAFSLTTLLLLEGLGPKYCAIHLALFSLAAPIAAVVTYTIFRLLNAESLLVVGIMLLFSGGTFLYSVFHVMQENLHKDYVPVDSFDPQKPPAAQRVSAKELALSVCGMLVPLLFALTDVH